MRCKTPLAEKWTYTFLTFLGDLIRTICSLTRIFGRRIIIIYFTINMLTGSAVRIELGTLKKIWN